MTTLNTDILDLGSGNSLKAVAYEEAPAGPGTGNTLVLLTNGLDSVIFSLGTNTQQPDLAFVNADPILGCSHYNLLITYVKNGDVFFIRCDITNPGGNPIGGGTVQTYNLTVNKNIHNAVYPHIDVFPDPGSGLCGGSKLRKAVVTWSQDGGSG
jgi:hypothetical protein